MTLGYFATTFVAGAILTAITKLLFPTFRPGFIALGWSVLILLLIPINPAVMHMGSAINGSPSKSQFDAMSSALFAPLASVLTHASFYAVPFAEMFIWVSLGWVYSDFVVKRIIRESTDPARVEASNRLSDAEQQAMLSTTPSSPTV